MTWLSRLLKALRSAEKADMKIFCLFTTCFLLWGSLGLTSPIGDNNALIVIDMQDYFVTRNAAYKDPANKQKVDAVIAQQIKMIKEAERLNLPIILIAYECRVCGPITKRLQDAIAKYANAKIIPKGSDGMFDRDNDYRDDLTNYLKEKRVGTLIVAGANGSACVEESIAGAMQDHYNVVTFENGIADFNFDKFIYPYTHHYQDVQSICDKACSFKEGASVEDVEKILGYDTSGAAVPSPQSSQGYH